MLTLAATNTLRGVAGTAAAVTCTVFGDEKGTADSFKVLYQGQIGSSNATLYTVPASNTALISRIHLVNTTAAPVSVALHVNGSASVNQIAAMQLPANGSAAYAHDGWKTYDSAGQQLFVGGIGPTGSQGEKGWSPILAIVADGARSVLQITDWTGGVGTKPSTTNQFIGPTGIVGTAAAAVDIRGATGLTGNTGNTGTTGDKGWSPILSVVTDGERRVLQIVDWTGGQGTKPSTTNQFIGAAGIVSTAAAAVDIRGAQGATGTAGTNGLGVPAGGATNQVLRKNSATNNDTSWTDAVSLIPAASATVTGLQSVTNFIKTMTTALHYDLRADGGGNSDGSTDNRAIIEAAHTMLANFGGGVLYYPPVGDVATGKGFAVNSTVTLTGNYVTHRGANSVVSLVKRTFATGDTFVLNGANIQFEDLRIIGATNTLVTSGYAINVLAAATNVTIRDCDIIYHWSGIKATGQLCRIIQCNIREMGMNANNGVGILIDSFTDQYIDGVVMDNPVPPWGNAPGGPVGFAGIRITNLSSLQLINSQIIHCGNALDVIPTGTNTIPSIHAFNTFFDNSVIGCNIAGAAGSTVVRSNFLQCWFSSNTTAGVRIANSNTKGVDFIACEFYGNPVGFDVVDATEWSISGKSRVSGNTTAGVRVAVGTVPHAFSISDSFIGNGSNFGANAVGITLAAGTYDRIQILDNRGLDTNTTQGIVGVDAAVTAYPSRKNVANNMGHGLITGTVATGGPLAAGTTAEAEVIGFRAAANTLRAGAMIRFIIQGLMTNTTTSTNMIGRIRIGPTTLTGPIVASITQATGATARTNFPVTIMATVTIISVGAAGTALGVVNIMPAGGAVGAPSAAVTAAVAINTTVDNTVQLTFLTGAATTTANLIAREVQVVAS